MSELDKRNRPLSDEELDAQLPSEGYEIVTPPAGYAPIRTPARKLMQTPANSSGGFTMQEDSAGLGGSMSLAPELPTEIEGVGQLQFFKPEDAQRVEGEKIMRLLLKIKNGAPPMRKTALRQITDKAREFGAGPLFDKILPLLMERTLEDQERHLLVKVIDRPLLIDEDYYARVEGREIISNLSKAAGLAHMISTMRPDIIMWTICKSKKSWQARHTGIKIVQQIAIMMGCAVLPHLKNLVESISHGLEDEQQKRFEAAVDRYSETSWQRARGVLKAIGFIIPLMDAEYANYYTKEVMVILIREFQSPDEEMKKIVLKVVKQCSATDGVQPQYVKVEILPQFFANFWVRRMALDRRNYRQVVETTVELANKAGVTEIVSRIVNDLKDESEPYRKMVMETIEKVISALGANDIDERLEVQLIDGIIYAFQEQTVEDIVMLEGFGQLNSRPTLSYSNRLYNFVEIKQQISQMVIKQCGEDQLLSKLGVVLFEQLGEEYPDTLGSIIAAEASIANVVGMTQMSPPVKDLLPRMTPILRNRHEKVQEASINLIGRIADRGAEFVSAREWMRICFELLDLLKAHKKAIRRAAVNSLVTSQKLSSAGRPECSTHKLEAIVAETCGPFTCIPAILNEYRTPELNVRNGCLKSLSFLFEYIGEMGKDYINSVATCLEDALTDRDLVHRQTACSIVKHLALGTAGLGQEDANLHLMNLVWPNCFETSPHVIGACMDAIEAMRVAVGPGVVLLYTLQGLFHPARKVREVYWRIYNSNYLGAADAMVPSILTYRMHLMT
ncbi:hypothetical protein H4Q26_004330 [Puccinia striiformis f. sp. tritici PST-130]|nr:hypothetical protein H4Q26_004330 [Puccinia striiformis f. sp. tritici PST-130]